MSNEASDLSLHTTDELFHELSKRALSVVLLMERQVKTAKNQTEHAVWYNGMFTSAVGLCEYGKVFLLHRLGDQANWKDLKND